MDVYITTATATGPAIGTAIDAAIGMDADSGRRLLLADPAGAGSHSWGMRHAGPFPLEVVESLSRTPGASGRPGQTGLCYPFRPAT